MPRKRVAVLVVAVVALGSSIGMIVWPKPARPHITWETIAALEEEPKRSREQARTLIGSPPGDYSVGNAVVLLGPGNYGSAAWFLRTERTSAPRADIWIDEKFALVIHYDQQDRVEDLYFTLVETREDTMLNQIRRLLHMEN